MGRGVRSPYSLDLEDYDWIDPITGSATTLQTVPADDKPLSREFPPGFAGAAPGRSRGEAPKRRPRAKKAAQ